MRLIGREKLTPLQGKGDRAEKWLRGWVAEIISAHWKQPADVNEQFPNSSLKGDGVFHFPVESCGVAIQLMIAFPQGVALITDLISEDKHEH
ncbi:hypothetical protein ACS77_00440 [Pseudomonas syringae]|uniref:Type II toxin-antitoxin system HigB family toxin n=2 Tax=Pseudomonas TaxID=286 RepID=A0A0L1MQ05_PSESX|nr:hypothetical protein ACS77_00440 [Pseudomonas syringae]